MSDETTTKPATTAGEREAVGDEWATIELDGHTYTIPASAEHLDLDVLEAFENGKTIAALKGTFGPQQWSKLEHRVRKANDGRFTTKMLEPIANAVAEVLGFTSAGE